MKYLFLSCKKFNIFVELIKNNKSSYITIEQGCKDCKKGKFGCAHDLYRFQGNAGNCVFMEEEMI